LARVDISYSGNPVFKDQIVIRVTDLSPAGHVGFDSYVSILNDAATRFFQSQGVKRSADNPVGVLFADLAVIYRSEAFYGDTLNIEAAIEDIKSKGFDLVFRITSQSNGKEIALAKIGTLFYDYANEKVVPIPENLQYVTKQNI
jgi:acyl-CoA thioesterase FadM